MEPSENNLAQETPAVGPVGYSLDPFSIPICQAVSAKSFQTYEPCFLFHKIQKIEPTGFCFRIEGYLYELQMLISPFMVVWYSPSGHSNLIDH